MKSSPPTPFNLCDRVNLFFQNILEYSSTPSQCSPALPFNLCDRVDLLAESTRRVRRQQCNRVNRHLHRKYKYVCNKIQIKVQVQQVQGSESSARNTAILAVATKNSRIIRESVGMHQWRCTFLWPKNDWTEGQKRKGRGSNKRQRLLKGVLKNDQQFDLVCLSRKRHEWIFQT